MKQPSPALVISILALVVALSGSAYAAVKINGKDIKKGTVSGTALKKNTLTGTQIRESKLGKVPSAVNADKAAVADNATSASTLAGIAPGSLVKGSGSVLARNTTVPASSTATIIEVPGIGRLIGVCNTANELSVRVESAGADVTVRVTTTPTNNVVSTSGGTFDSGGGLNLPFFDQQKIALSLWRTGAQDVAYEITSASTGCRASAVAIGNG